MVKDFLNTLIDYQHRVETVLSQVIATDATASPLLAKAMTYATLNGGKRLRPVLVYATGQTLGQSLSRLDFIAAAVECIHCYSLIHDDLPAMDDDNLRRGKPTCHIAFNEATAILAGDALETLAFRLLSIRDQHTAISAELQLRMVNVLTELTGASGMVAGQLLDLSSEGKTLTVAELENMHALKTGGLIRASVILGVLGAGCDDQNTIARFDEFAKRIGLIFQLQDDLLDITGNSKVLGKNARQDIKLQKSTYAILCGVEATQKRISVLMQETKQILNAMPYDVTFLQELCEYLLRREY